MPMSKRQGSDSDVLCYKSGLPNIGQVGPAGGGMRKRPDADLQACAALCY